MVRPLFNEPLRLLPFLRPMPWGGHRLAELAGAATSGDPIGEAWLLSDHPLHRSVVANGPSRGQTLGEVLARDCQAILGSAGTRFPLLIKLLDARENLSVQVHPDDDLARSWSPGDGGKTEAWIVVGAEPDAVIYLGLKPGVDAVTFAHALKTNTAVNCLQAFKPQAGETYFVPAGTVHALGGGTMVLEVQQTSDATFRLYDWGRVDALGNPRRLHLEAGLACLKERPPGAGRYPPQPNGLGGEVVVDCPFFSITHWRGPRTVDLERPGVLIALGHPSWCEGVAFREKLGHGDTVLFPHGLSTRLQLPDDHSRVFQVIWPLAQLT